jgi:hypothetical protein
VNVSSPDESTSHTRHFHSIESIITDQKDDKHFFIQYNDSRPIAQCYAMTSSEGTIIRDLLTDIIDKERLPTDVYSPSSYMPYMPSIHLIIIIVIIIVILKCRHDVWYNSHHQPFS